MTKRSPIDITYDEIVDNPRLCQNNPLGRTRELNGDLVLWEGRKDEHNLQSPLFRVIETKQSHLKFERFDKRYNEWVPVPCLEPRRQFFRKKDDVAPGTVRIEMFANGRVKRTQG